MIGQGAPTVEFIAACVTASLRPVKVLNPLNDAVSRGMYRANVDRGEHRIRIGGVDTNNQKDGQISRFRSPSLSQRGFGDLSKPSMSMLR